MPFIPYFKLIDATLIPVLLYGSEVWGTKSFDCIEKINRKACKQFMMVSSKTTNVAVLGDCGRYPLYISSVIRLISYWAKIIQMSSDRYPHKCYKMLHHLDNSGHSTWATNIKDILFKLGFGIVWISQDIGCVNNFLIQLSTRMHDIFSQEWFTEICASSKLSSYREFKSMLCPERYLLEITIPCHRRALSRLRCSSHPLMIESGRINNIEINDRICPLCDSGEIEDEFHFVLICSFYDVLRLNLPNRYTVWPNRFKFNLLMRSDQTDIVKSLAFYVYNAFLKREKFFNG
jgi:hypothetical protein